MTATAEPRPAGPDNEAQPDATCERCGAPVAPDQEWCIECGGARTLIHKPPDWRIPAAVIGTVVALVLAAFAIALVNLSTQANRSAATTTVTQTVAALATSTATAGATPAPQRPIHHWPPGQTGWTVQVSSSPSSAAARTRARQLIRARVQVGVLDSSRHPAMTPGQWIVFAGQFPTEAGAKARASRLSAHGYPGATPVLVATPAG